jgi:hypothetical protein
VSRWSAGGGGGEGSYFSDLFAGGAGSEGGRVVFLRRRRPRDGALAAPCSVASRAVAAAGPSERAGGFGGVASVFADAVPGDAGDRCRRPPRRGRFLAAPGVRSCAETVASVPPVALEAVGDRIAATSTWLISGAFVAAAAGAGAALSAAALTAPVRGLFWFWAGARRLGLRLVLDAAGCGEFVFIRFPKGTAISIVPPTGGSDG